MVTTPATSIPCFVRCLPVIRHTLYAWSIWLSLVKWRRPRIRGLFLCVAGGPGLIRRHAAHPSGAASLRSAVWSPRRARLPFEPCRFDSRSHPIRATKKAPYPGPFSRRGWGTRIDSPPCGSPLWGGVAPLRRLVAAPSATPVRTLQVRLPVPPDPGNKKGPVSGAFFSAWLGDQDSNLG